MSNQDALLRDEKRGFQALIEFELYDIDRWNDQEEDFGIVLPCCHNRKWKLTLEQEMCFDYETNELTRFDVRFA
jgi:hypothetical protein